MTGLVACYVTVPSRAVADVIAQSLVSKQLAACVNIIPGIQSVYTWKGVVQRDEELLLMIKSRAQLFPLIVEDVKAHHPYDVPEVISVAIQDGHQPYLDWVHENTKEKEDQ
mmetsp:Transcript_44095/g.50973  ORF Transcript_44095/g.50973 Transcript_44095/m.50973 type:complete len:111 (+) Transcript_44095:71-403(+)|eukprot:CAMPEP_0176414538 /NCGR_PEP_ID=MMETSP0127-20121128/5311_1 /TAXON_ID=938130 /ORGANISM="Platyophrya macrostoma, Strain WH" /LENGTH=110 /DNA_ID=CAMNT_0017794443 /DNA_START=71 /DNA_END=403 /DNA_ORIENTATION=+